MADGKRLNEAMPAALGLPLCAGAGLEERGHAWVWDVLQHGRPARAFALRFEGEVRAYMNRCVHVPTEMDWQPGEFFDMEKRFILCSVHGASYAPEHGRCVGGPCGRGSLTRVAVAERDGQVYWYPSRGIEPVLELGPFAEVSPSPASESPS